MIILGDYDFSSLTLWELTLARSGDDELIQEGPIKKPASTEVMRFCTETTLQIDETCAGLLETHSKDLGDDIDSMAQRKITYIHRTVRDW